MKAARFDYVRAASVCDAVAHLEQAGGNARILAGGQTLGPMLNMRLATPTLLVDIGGIATLKQLDTAA